MNNQNYNHFSLDSQRVLCFTGPTASGKSRHSYDLIQALIHKKIRPPSQIHVINIDSVAFYKGLSITSAAPSKDEQSLCAHYLFETQGPTDNFDLGKFIYQVENLINSLLQNDSKNIIILVGGSPFYLRGLFQGETSSANINELDFSDQKKAAQDYINTLNHFEIVKKLQELDPLRSSQLHPNDLYRQQRALEYFLTYGKSMTSIVQSVQNPYDLNSGKNQHWNTVFFYFDLEKKRHWEIIQQRTASMIKQGIINEIQNLLTQYQFKGNESAIKSIGAIETIEYCYRTQQLGPSPYENAKRILQAQNLIEKKHDQIIDSIEKLEERISISTRQLAKSQRTFFNKIPNLIKVDDLSSCLALFKLID